MKYLHFYAQIHSAWGRARYNLQYFFKQSKHLIHLGIIVALQVLLWWQAVNIYHQAQSEFLVLHYNVDFGIDLLAKVSSIFYLPLAVLLANLINLISAIIFFKEEQKRLLVEVILVSNAVILLFSNLALFILFLINFR